MNKKKASTLQLEWMPLDSVKLWDRNPKLHDEEHIIESITRLGFLHPLILNEKTNQLVSGHGRIKAVQKIKKLGNPPPNNITVKKGVWHVPVIRGVSFDTEEDANRFALAINRLVETGGMNHELLSDMLSDLANHPDLSASGYTVAEVDDILKSSTPNIDKGQTPAERKESYDKGDKKQLVFYFSPREHQQALNRINAIMQDNDIESIPEVILFLLDIYEGNPR